MLNKTLIAKVIVIVGIVIAVFGSLSFGQQPDEPNYVQLFDNGLKECYRFRNPYGGLLRQVSLAFGESKVVTPTVVGLDNSDAIPFLTDVLKNGANWLPDSEQHLARCYAAMCLGTTRNSAALKPLIEALQIADKKDEEQRKYIAEYAASALGIFGDANAVEPLIEALDDKRPPVHGGAIWSLSELGDFRAVGPIMKILEETSQQYKERQKQLEKILAEPAEPNAPKKEKMILDAEARISESRSKIWDLSKCLTKLTKVKYEAESESIRDEVKSSKRPIFDWTYELAEALPNLWTQWWRGGPQFTRGRFEAKRNEWKAMKKETNDEKYLAKNKLSEITDLGIPAIPFMIEKVEQGETDYIPLVSKLTNRELPESATSEECLAWWEKNKQKWTIPFPY